MMDRAHLEEYLSAYLDGELSAEEVAKIERELEKHPDLRELVERMRKLNALAKSSRVEMPDEQYFDQLAERIEAKLPERERASDAEEPSKRATVVDLLAANRKTVKIVGSVAAVLLVALIGLQMYGPGTPEYPGEIRRYEVGPAIDRQKMESPESVDPILPGQETQSGRQAQPVPEIEDEDVESDTLLKAGRDAIEPSKTKDEPLGGTDMSGAILEMNGLSGGRAEELMHADSMQLRKQLESAAQMFMPAPQTFSLNERPPVDSLREFAFGDLGYRDIPEPDEFANTAMEKLDATKKLAVDTLAKKESRQAVTTAERPLTATGDAAAESGRVATSELLARAELAWQTAISDSSNVYDVIFARLLTERVLRAEAEKATWANRLMQLVRLEQFERNRWLESRSQDSSTAPAND